MTLTLGKSMLADHRVPDGAKIVEPGSCEFCARPLYRKLNGKTVCPPCAVVFEVGAQIWVCGECETPRKWGEGLADDPGKKYLRCARCLGVTGEHRVTRHHFWKVSRGER
jgi:hypothetical protein